MVRLCSDFWQAPHFEICYLLERDAYLRVVIIWDSVYIRGNTVAIQSHYNKMVFIKQMVWETRFIFTLLIKHVQKFYICVPWSMNLPKHSTEYKTDCQQTATKNNNSCAEVLYKKNFLKNFAKSTRKHLC